MILPCPTKLYQVLKDSMKPLFLIASLFMVSGCAIYNSVTSCAVEYERYKDWKEHLEKGTEYYNTNVSIGKLAPEEKQEFEADLLDLQINMNEASFDFHECKRSYFKENKLY